MTKELASFLVDAAEHCGVEIELRDDYSGRGMYGQTTQAVIVQNPSELILNVIQYIKETLENMTQDELAKANFIPDVSDLGHLRTDNMARDTVIY
jgi:hypothetical protein